MKLRALALAACALSVSGCMTTTTPVQNTTRSDTAALMFTQSGSEIDALHHQAAVLDTLASNIVRQSTLTGAAVGGALGCGLGLATGSGVQRCVAGAVVLGTAGAVVGNAQGKAKVAAKMQTAAPEILARDLRSANDQMSFMSKDLGSVLERQDQRLAQLTSDHSKGRISQKQYRAAVQTIYDDRKKLADILDSSHTKSKHASKALSRASLTGGKIVQDQAKQARKLETSIASERARVDLLSLSALLA